MTRKKKVLVHSNLCLSKTGFGRHCKLLLSHLYETGKYDLVEYAAAPFNWSHPICKSMPWPTYGALPDNEQELTQFQHDPALIQAIKYGEYNINKVIELEKPDVIIMVEDIWGIPHFNKPWFNKVTSVIWTPIDSLPLLPVFKDNKDKLKNLWVKAEFAKVALEKQGVKSEFMPALIDHKDFNIHSEEQKIKSRLKYGIAKDTKIFGFVFRNQVRKLIGTLIEGFSLYKQQNPESDCKLLLHTCWTEQEGWRILDFMERFGVDRKDVLTTHICNKCRDISIRPFYGQECNCKKCGSEKSVNTVSIDIGVTESELCEIYNLMDAYVHPATSGGFEMPVLEAMFCGLPIAVPDYSFGEDFCLNERVWALEYSTYHERGSQFDKAQVKPESIVDFFTWINNMSDENKKQISNDIRDWALDRYDYRKICKQVEDFIDSSPEIEYNFIINDEKNENYPMPDILDNLEFVKDLYNNMLGVDVSNNPTELNNALSLFNAGFTKEQVYEKFVEVAKNHNSKIKKVKLEDLLDNESDKKKLLYVEGGNLADCIDSISILEELTKKYSPEEWDYYVSCQMSTVFEHLNFIKKTLPYDPFFEDVLAMEGHGEHLGYFDLAFHPKFVRSCTDYFKNNYVTANS